MLSSAIRIEPSGLVLGFTAPDPSPERGAEYTIDEATTPALAIYPPSLLTRFSSLAIFLDEGFETLPERPLPDLGMVLPPAPLPRGP